MTTYQNGIADLRTRLDEKGVARYWQDPDLLNWIVEGATDIARRTETLVEYNRQINAASGVSDYVLPVDCLRVHRIEYIPQTTANPPQVYPLQLSTYYEMDQRWGASQFLQSVYPTWAVIRGTPGNPLQRGSGTMIFKVYPVPSQPGGFNTFYYALPSKTPQLTDQIAVSLGWENLPILYAEHVAMRADRDPRWQEARQLYESDLMNMMDMTRRLHDQAGQMSWQGSGGTGYGGGYTYDGMFGGW